MKRILILCIMFISMATLTACMSASANLHTASEVKTIIKMELDKNYDSSDPFINEKLFCVSDNLDHLTAQGKLQMDGNSGMLEVKNNKTNKVLWNNAWEGNISSETFSIPLEDLKKDDEYVICFTGTKINHVMIEISFESDSVQEREMPFW